VSIYCTLIVESTENTTWLLLKRAYPIGGRLVHRLGEDWLEWNGIVGWASGGLWRVVFEWRRSNIGLCSFRCCSGMSSLLWWNDCMYICSYGSKRVGELICLRRVIVSAMLPCSCLQLSMCSAYAERGSLFLMYRMCSRNLDFKFWLVCPTYTLLQFLRLVLYIPLFSCSCNRVGAMGFYEMVQCCCSLERYA